MKRHRRQSGGSRECIQPETSSAVDPSGVALRHRALVVAQGFLCGEEPTALVTEELADLPVLRDLVPQSIMLPGEALRTTLCALEGDLLLRLVCLHVHLQCILTGEFSVTSENEAGETAPVDLLDLLSGRRGVSRPQARQRRLPFVVLYLKGGWRRGG